MSTNLTIEFIDKVAFKYFNIQPDSLSQEEYWTLMCDLRDLGVGSEELILASLEKYIDEILEMNKVTKSKTKNAFVLRSILLYRFPKRYADHCRDWEGFSAPYDDEKPI